MIDKDAVKLAADPTVYKNYLPDISSTGSQRKALCPFHADTHPSLTVSNRSGAWVWYCQPCKTGGDILKLVTKLKNCSFQDALKEVANLCGIEDDGTSETDSHSWTFDAVDAKAALAVDSAAMSYLKGRGISAEIASHAGLGVTNYPGIGRALAIPYSDQVVKFRSLSPDVRDKKFRHLAGGSSGDSLYGIKDFNNFPGDSCFFDQDVYVVESELDALTMRSHGLSAISVSSATTCVSSDGSLKLNPTHVKELDKAEKIYLFLDQDAPGQACADAFEKALPRFKTLRVTWPYGGKESKDAKDVGELYTKDPTTFVERLEALKQIASDRKRRAVFVFADLPKASEFANENCETKWLVDKFLPLQESSLLCGLWGNYKSFIALSLAKAVATGEKWLGVYPTIQRPVLYLDKENSRAEVGKRVRNLNIPDTADLRIWCERNSPFPKIGDDRLLRIAEDYKPFVVVDTLIGFSEAEDENNAREMRVELEKYTAMVSRGATVLMLHHPPKGNGREKGEADWFRGSGDIAAFVSMGFYCVCTNTDDGTIELQTKKSRTGERENLVLQAWPYLNKNSEEYIGDFKLVGDLDEEFAPDTSDHGRPALLLKLIEQNAGITQTDLVKKSGLSRQNIRTLCQRYDGKLWQSVDAGRTKTYVPLQSRLGNFTIQ
jgi:5S rRNA maturation endonuclease (ribonuclease M5)